MRDTAMQRFSDEVGDAVEAMVPRLLQSDSLAACNAMLSPLEQHEIEKAALLNEARERGII